MGHLPQQVVRDAKVTSQSMPSSVDGNEATETYCARTQHYTNKNGSETGAVYSIKVSSVYTHTRDAAWTWSRLCLRSTYTLDVVP